MSYWVEIHCDTTLAQRDNTGTNERGQWLCETNDGDHPGAMGKTPARAAKDALKLAKQSGWRMVEGVGMCCPACAKVATPPTGSE